MLRNQNPISKLILSKLKSDVVNPAAVSSSDTQPRIQGGRGRGQGALGPDAQQISKNSWHLEPNKLYFCLVVCVQSSVEVI